MSLENVILIIPKNVVHDFRLIFIREICRKIIGKGMHKEKIVL